MNVGDLQKFFDSLGTLFAAKTGNPHADMAALSAALDPFTELSLSAFTAFLHLAKEYKETGILTPAANKGRAPTGKGRTAKAAVKTKTDVVAIQEAVDELERLFSRSADQDLTYATIETTVQRIQDSFDKDALKEVAKGFNITSGVGTKKGCREKIEHKIKERKARNERGEVIAAAAKIASSPEGAADDGVVEATVLENK